MKRKIYDKLVWFFAVLIRLFSKFDCQFFRHIRFQATDSKLEYVFSSIEWEGQREHYICFPYDQAISKHIFADGHFGWANVTKVFNILEKNYKIETFIDIGANIGSICIPIVKRGFAKNAIAFEPEPKNFRTLMANIYMNGLSEKIVTHNIALDMEERNVEFEISNDNSGDHRVRVSEKNGLYGESLRKAIKVKSQTLDRLLPVLREKDCLIWMDTQGYEGRVLEGAKKICEARIPLVVEFWPYGLDRASCYDLLKKALLNYQYIYDLSETKPKQIQLSEKIIDDLYNKFKSSDENTDLLLI